MFLGPGLCIPPRPEFRCGPIAGTSAGPRVVNKNLFVRSQPRCMAGSLSWCCEGIPQITVCTVFSGVMLILCSSKSKEGGSSK